MAQFNIDKYYHLVANCVGTSLVCIGQAMSVSDRFASDSSALWCKENNVPPSRKFDDLEAVCKLVC